jgi:hypothetical protein
VHNIAFTKAYLQHTIPCRDLTCTYCSRITNASPLRAVNGNIVCLFLIFIDPQTV